MKKTFKGFLALGVVLLLITSLMCISALADGEEETTTYVAQIGDDKYEDLYSAMQAVADGGEITLLTDYTYPEGTSTDATGNGSYKGYTIKGNTASTKLTFTKDMGIWGATEITFKDITVVSNGGFTVGNSSKVTFGENTVLTSADGKETQKACLIKTTNDAVLTLSEGCTVKNAWVSSDGVVKAENGTVNVNGAKFSDISMNGSLVCVYNNAVLNVSGATSESVWINEGTTKAQFFVSGSTAKASITGEISVSGGSNLRKLVYAATPANLTNKTGLITFDGDDNTFYSDTTIVVTKDGASSTYYNISDAITNASGATISIYKDWEVTAESGYPLNNKIFTVDGNGHKLTLDITNAIWGNNTSLAFEDVTVCLKKSLSIGDSGKLTFDSGAVLTTDGAELDAVIKTPSGSPTITFKSGSKVKNINVTNAVVLSTCGTLTVEENVAGEDIVTSSGVIAKASATYDIKSGFGGEAKIGGTVYTTFLNALKQANSNTIDVLKDCVYEGGFVDVRTYGINGNNHTITLKDRLLINGNNDTLHSAVTMKDLKLVLGKNQGTGIGLYGSTLGMENVTMTAAEGITPAVGITIETASSVTATSCEFTNMTLSASDNQTSVFKVITTGSSLTLTNCKIKDNTGSLGAGISVYNDSVVNIKGGEISGNKSWTGPGIKVYDGGNSIINVSGSAVISGNKMLDTGNPANNIELNGSTLNVENFTGTIGVCRVSSGGKPVAIAEGTMIGSITGTLKTAGAITSDADDTLIAYAKEGKLYMIKKPDLTVTTDSGVYAKGAKGVIRAMSTFTNTTDGTVIEACGTYFVKTAPTAGDSTKTSQWSIENVAASNGKGFQADLYGIDELTQSIVAVSWYKLSGVDEYIYVIGSAVTVDATNTVEYTEA